MIKKFNIKEFLFKVNEQSAELEKICADDSFDYLTVEENKKLCKAIEYYEDFTELIWDRHKDYRSCRSCQSLINIKEDDYSEPFVNELLCNYCTKSINAIKEQ